MIRALKLLNVAACQFGIDVRRLYLNTVGLPFFVRSLLAYKRAPSAERLPARLKYLRPMLADRGAVAGVVGGHYFHQDLWAARKIFESRPARHVDVGSRLDGFVAHILPFVPVEVVDIRHLDSTIEGLTFVQEDATELKRFASNSVESLSSLHAVEHFGLGRYGDPVDPEACFKALRNMARVLRPGGRFYLGVPVGRERVEFNAHRVFNPRTIIGELRDLRLVAFSAVDDAGAFQADATLDEMAMARYACGLFEFTK